MTGDTWYPVRGMNRSASTRTTSTPAGSTPASSAASRSAAAAAPSSPGSITPPGNAGWPACRRSDLLRWTSSRSGPPLRVLALAEQDQDRRRPAAPGRRPQLGRHGHLVGRIGQIPEPAWCLGPRSRERAGLDQLGGHRRVGQALRRRTGRARPRRRHRRPAAASGRPAGRARSAGAKAIVHSERGISAPTSVSIFTGSSEVGPAKPVRQPAEVRIHGDPRERRTHCRAPRWRSSGPLRAA